MNYTACRTAILVLALGSAAWTASSTLRRFHAEKQAGIAAAPRLVDRPALAAQIRKEQEASRAADLEIAQMRASLAVHRSIPATLAPSGGSISTRELVSKALNQPDLQTLCLVAERAQLTTRYAAFFQSLKLKPDQIEKLTELLCRRNELEMDLDEIARAHQLAAAEPTLARTRENAHKAFRTDFVSAFGESSYLLLTTYERKLPVWDFVNKLAGTVAVVDEPLSSDQATALVETLANSSTEFREGRTATPETVDWPVVITQTVPILTPPQQMAFRNAAPRYPVPIDNSPVPAPPAPSD